MGLLPFPEHMFGYALIMPTLEDPAEFPDSSGAADSYIIVSALRHYN